MEITKIVFWLTTIGLFMNFIGTLIVAFSFGRNLGDAYQEDKKGRKIYLASFLRPKGFIWGLSLIIFGFFLQIIASLFNK